MYKGKKIVCIIPVKGKSRGLPGKNLKLFNEKPLLAHSIEQAEICGLIDRIIVSTDDRTIERTARKYGAEVPFIRPKSLAKDNTSTIDVLLHCIEWLDNSGYQFDVLVLLHATAPLRQPGDISKCVRMLFFENASNVFSVNESHRNPYYNMVEINKNKVKLSKKGNFNSRQAAPSVYDMNASIYVWRKDVLEKQKSLFCDKTRIYVMPKERSVDIDDETDFRIAEFLSKNKFKNISE